MAPMEQLYVCLSEMKDVPDQTNLSAEELGWQHHAYLQNLLDRGILMGSGSAKDETGRRHAGGIIIVRAASLQESRGDRRPGAIFRQWPAQHPGHSLATHVVRRLSENRAEF